MTGVEKIIVEDVVQHWLIKSLDITCHRTTKGCRYWIDETMINKAT
jgi:hypothetical protein